jgi:hypothetical protein
MRNIPLGKNLFAQVDNDLYAVIMASGPWHVHEYKNGLRYAEHTEQVSGRTNTVRMHQFISGERYIDHIDCNGLNNQRSNLRKASRQQQNRNRRKFSTSAGKPTSSVYKGVSRRRNGKWSSSIQIDGKSKYLGYFVEEVEAAKRYDIEASKIFGEFANLNFI